MNTNTYTATKLSNDRQQVIIMLAQPRTMESLGKEYIVDRIIWVSNRTRDDFYWSNANGDYLAAGNREYNNERAFAIKVKQVSK